MIRAVVLTVTVSLVPLAAVHAQCTNLTGSPAPVFQQYASNKIKLKYLGTGPGSNDDQPQLFKSTFQAPTLTFNPATTTYVTVTLWRNMVSGPMLWNTTIPPSPTLWSSVTLGNGTVRWKFNDPLVTYGVRKAQVNAIPGGTFIIVKLLGKFQNIANAPLTTPNADVADAMVEMHDGAGNGFCYDGPSAPCTGSGNTQTCKAF
jgi:hypothetical protein